MSIKLNGGGTLPNKLLQSKDFGFIGVEPNTLYKFNNDKKYLKKLPAYGIVLPNGVKDTVEKIDGKKTVVQRLYKGLITQLEDYNIWNEYTGKYTKAIYAYSGRWSLPACKAKNNEVCILSDKFLSCTHDEWQKIKEPNYCALRNDGLLHFFVDRTMSKENFNDWLSENPVTIYYELAKPIYTQI